MSIRETAMPDGSLSFVGIMRAVPSSEHLIVLDADQRVTACSLESFGLLGLSPEELASGTERPHMSHWVREWSAIQDALAVDAGTTMLVMPQHDGAASPSKSAGAMKGSAATATDEPGVWVSAHLQSVSVPGPARISILYWKHLSTNNRYAVRS
jgi:hypothetical protein